MADHEIRPGDNLHIIWPVEQQTPFGKQTVESKFSFSYTELLRQLTAKNRSALAQSPESEAIRASRSICITAQALQAGKWSTGAPLDQAQTSARLLKKISSLSPEALQNLSGNAQQSLRALIHPKDKALSVEQKALLKEKIAILK
ncbi:MAG: hypothetical protein OXT67_04745 [Zetaproteobacteria bacterium]|nr:hypothetical protein [Zetaproteobacteria bacterium]